MKQVIAWTPGILMGVAAFLTVGIDTQHSMPLEASLDSVIPWEIGGYSGRDIQIPEQQLRVAAPSNYLMRSYELEEDSSDTNLGFSLYIGYYERQKRGTTIHTPKNCLPGGGWSILRSERVPIGVGGEAVTINQYLLQWATQQTLAIYWYQGRGAVRANEYQVKWDLLRDAALLGRTDEALIRVVVPILDSEREAHNLAIRVATTVIPQLSIALPQ